MSDAAPDELVHAALQIAVDELEDVGLSGPEIRERTHFDPAVKRAFRGLTRENVRSFKLTTPHFPGLGSVDVAVPRPPLLVELKWSYNERRSKIFESVWDAIKLVLLASEYGCTGYVATGASTDAWSRSESRDLFYVALADPRALWALPLVPRGPNGGHSVGEDLILGSPSHSRPVNAPRRMTLTPLAPIAVRGGYEVRTARVACDGPLHPW